MEEPVDNAGLGSRLIDSAVLVTRRNNPTLAKISRCLWRDRQPHRPKRPGTLTVAAVRHIEQQIATNGFRPLPCLGTANRFYRCKDCYAVWVARSLFERVAQDRVCGVYDHTLKWKPYP